MGTYIMPPISQTLNPEFKESQKAAETKSKVF
jgi:hypothetical protein